MAHVILHSIFVDDADSKPSQCCIRRKGDAAFRRCVHDLKTDSPERSLFSYLCCVPARCVRHVSYFVVVANLGKQRTACWGQQQRSFPTQEGGSVFEDTDISQMLAGKGKTTAGAKSKAAR